MEERRLRTDDQPKSLVYERLNATAYEAHPYRTPVVGWMNDLENMRVEDARDWYHSWYAPNNASLVVVGDVAAQEVFALAQKQFGRSRRVYCPCASRRSNRRSADQASDRQSACGAALSADGLAHASLRDVDKDWAPYALEMLAAVLDGSDAARLNRELVRESRVAGRGRRLRRDQSRPRHVHHGRHAGAGENGG